MRITFEVQNGMVQSRNNVICVVRLRMWNTRKCAIVKPSTSVIAQTIRQNLSVIQ